MNDENLNFPNTPNPQSVIEPELEARIVAWIAGEASAFESAELERITAERPEVAAFKREMEGVQNLIGSATQAEAEPLRLSDDRRAKLLEAIGAGAGENTTPTPPVAVLPLPAARRNQWAKLNWILGAAATIAIGAFVLTRLTGPTFGVWKDAPDVRRQMSERAAKDREVSVRAAIDLQEERLAERKARDEGANHAVANEPALALSLPSVAMPPAEQKDGLLKNLESDRTAAMGAGGSLKLEQSVGFGQAVPSDTLTQNLKLKFGGIDDLSALANRRSFSAPPAATGVGGRVAGAGAVTLGNSVFLDATTSGKIVPTNGLAAGRVDSAVAAAPAGSPPTESVPVFDLDARRPGIVGVAGVERSKADRLLATDTADKKAMMAGEVTTAATTASLSVGGAMPAPAAPAPAEPMQLSAFEVTSSNGAAGKAQAVAANKAKLPRLAESQTVLAAKPALSPAVASVPEPNEEISTVQNSVSTFSLHVSDVSFRLAQAALAAVARGENPPEPKIRPEEFYNAFDYGDPAPAALEKIACRIEQAAHPFLQQRNLVRIAMKVAATGRGAGQPLRLTVLLDTSGSMEREDRAAAVRRALEVLVSLLGPNDRLTLIGFARQPRLLAENLAGSNARTALDIAAHTPAEGGTNLEEALKLGRELALRHRDPAAQNRIVVLTDGAANLGNADPAQLDAMVQAMREQGIAFDACGVGLEGTGDAVLEALTRKGNGRYYVLDSAEAADASFARQLAGAFRPAAENVKLQVRFNPARVGHYRLIGFDQHRLREEDFRNDAVDAAELAAEEAAVAVYQVEVLPEGTGELGEVFVRFKDAATGAMVENSWPIAYDAAAKRFDRATPSMQLAGVAALLAEKMQEGKAADQINLRELEPVVSALRTQYAQQPRVQELATMFAQVRKLLGE